MAITLPFPVRVAAGLIATGIDVVRSLPEELPAIPVTLVGNAMKLSMKVQQEIATLATRGDELLGGVIAAPQETPSWATFDDEPAAPTPTPTPTSKPRLKSAPTGDQVPSASRAGTSTTTPGKSSAGGSTGSADSPAPTGTSSPGSADDELTTPAESSVAPVTTTAMDAALEVPESVLDLAIGIDPDEPADKDSPGKDSPRKDSPNNDKGDKRPRDRDQREVATPPAGAAAAQRDPSSNGSPDDRTGTAASAPVEDPAADDGPAALPGYDRMTLAQVRGHLRELSSDEVSALLRYEQDGNNRAPFLTLLSNRLVTLDAQNS